MKKLLFEICELPRQKPTKIFFSELQLHDKYLRYRAKFNATEIDEDTSIEKHDVGNYYDVIALRSKVVGVELLFTDTEKWKIIISVSGVAQDIKIYFIEYAKAKAFHEEVFEWILAEKTNA